MLNAHRGENLVKTKFSFGLAMVAGATLVAFALAAPVAQAQDCSRKIGGVLSLTGAVGTFGVPNLARGATGN